MPHCSGILISSHRRGHCHRPRATGSAPSFLFALLALLGPWQASAAENPHSGQHLPYQLGQGLYFPQHKLRLGGYASVHYYDLEHRPNTLNVNDLSLFLTKDFGVRWQLFSEVEIGDALTVTADSTHSRDADFDVERLYADYHARQGVTLRFGKFLTPIGQWNLIHADPLVWTVARPLTTSAAFSRHATGAMMYGTVLTGSNDLDYWLFLDNTEKLDPAQRHELAFSTDGATSTLQNNFKQAAGARLLYHMLDDRLSLGASYLHYELQEPERQYRLSGIDFSWSGEYADLSGEAIYRIAQNAVTPDEHGGFVQAVIPLPSHLYLVGRYERYKTSILPDTTTLNTVGVNYRPWPTLAFKLEHRKGSHNDQIGPDGWLGSFAVLF